MRWISLSEKNQVGIREAKFQCWNAKTTGSKGLENKKNPTGLRIISQLLSRLHKHLIDARVFSKD